MSRFASGMSRKAPRIIIRFKKKKKRVRRVGRVFLLAEGEDGSERGERPRPPITAGKKRERKDDAQGA